MPTNNIIKRKKREKYDGRSRRPEYKVWHAMIRRCTNQKDESWKNYGGRGISVLPEWKESFTAFFRDMGPRPSPQHTIERRKNDEGYSKENCVWALKQTQANNTRTNKYITLNGETLSLAEWVRRLGIKYALTNSRLHNGWSVEQAFGLSARTIIWRGNPKISESRVREIRRMKKDGHLIIDIARKFGMNRVYIGRLCAMKHWKNVTEQQQ